MWLQDRKWDSPLFYRHVTLWHDAPRLYLGPCLERSHKPRQLVTNEGQKPKGKTTVFKQEWFEYKNSIWVPCKVMKQMNNWSSPAHFESYSVRAAEFLTIHIFKKKQNTNVSVLSPLASTPLTLKPRKEEQKQKSQKLCCSKYWRVCPNSCATKLQGDGFRRMPTL